jgi:hypothetical protein
MTQKFSALSISQKMLVKVCNVAVARERASSDLTDRDRLAHVPFSVPWQADTGCTVSR